LFLKNILRTKTRGFKMLKILENQNEVMRLWKLWNFENYAKTETWGSLFFFNLKSPEQEDLTKIKELPDTRWSASSQWGVRIWGSLQTTRGEIYYWNEIWAEDSRMGNLSPQRSWSVPQRWWVTGITLLDPCTTKGRGFKPMLCS